MNRANFAIPLVNGTFDQLLPGFEPGYHQLVFTYGTKPTAGRMAVFTKTGIDDDWLPLAEAQNLDMTTGRIVIAFGAISAYRFVISGLLGGAGLTAWISSALEWPGPGMPDGLFTGLRAMTVQPYTEANVKNGLQYNIRATWPLTDTIAAGTSRKIWFKTTTKPVIVKLRELQFIAEELTLRLFRGPTGVTLGTDLTVHNYNAVNPVATTCFAKKNVTTVSDGTEFDANDAEVFFGSANDPQRGVAFALQGRERVLPADTEFIVSIANSGTGNARVQYFLDFYEGGTDLPLN